MNHKVLLADDSLTIQKVIKITLANQPYDITDCSSEEQLFQQLATLQPKLVFLDFNLSEKYTGYDLTAKIKSLSPASKVLLLLGTFDTIDAAAMEKSGASEKIVKPFDSNKFIAVCKQLVETFANEELSYPEAKPETPAAVSASAEDNWTVSHSTEQKFEDVPLDDSFPEVENLLLKEMSDWGMSVPGIINEQGSHDNWIDLPPVIEGDAPVTAKLAPKIETGDYSTKFPKTDDLDYPSFDDLPRPAADATDLSDNQLGSISSELQFDSYFPNESDVRVIEDQIKDEVEDNLWQVDEFEELKKEVSQKMEEARSNFLTSQKTETEEPEFKAPNDQEIEEWDKNFNFVSETFKATAETPAPVSMEDLKPMMEELVKKYVQEYLEQMFKTNVEKVTWEVIPDLAENLIRQELSKISHKIMDDQA
ncbi:MAG TPA: response regulator [Bacteriovoracaceae bacterium]|nr:response regulator [Bacteriovoracaceae bacterium]